VSEGVHEVKEAGGAMRVPPCGGEGVEVGDFGGGDGRGGAGGAGRGGEIAMLLEVAFGGAWCSAEEEGEVTEGGGREEWW